MQRRPPAATRCGWPSPGSPLRHSSHDRLTRRVAGVTVAPPEGRRLLRLEARNAQTPIERKPPWIKTRARMGREYTQLRALVATEGLHTVCQEAGCPNIYERSENPA